MKKRGDTMSLRIDGKKISSDIKEELKEQVKLLKEEGISVCLAVIQVGNEQCGAKTKGYAGTTVTLMMMLTELALEKGIVSKEKAEAYNPL